MDWTEDREILSLITAEHGLVSVGYRQSKSHRKPGMERRPELFSRIRGTLQRSPEGPLRLRSFETLNSFMPRSAAQYGAICLGARLMLLSLAEESPEDAAYHRWLERLLEEIPVDREARLNILADWHYLQGTWPGALCEVCSRSPLAGAGIHAGRLICSRCQQTKEVLGEETCQWLVHRYRHRGHWRVEERDRLPIRNWLMVRSPENIRRDPCIRHCLATVSSEILQPAVGDA